MSHIDYTFKVLVLGESGIGKKTLIENYLNRKIDLAGRLSIGVDWYLMTIELDNLKIKLQLWLFGGEERFRFLLPKYCLGANGAILIYDITRSSTLENISKWLKIIKARAGTIPVMLVGNKIELEKFRAVPREYGIQVAEKNNMDGFVEISAKDNINVDETFKLLTELMLETTNNR